MAQSTDYIDRMETEGHDLSEKIEKLAAFLTGPIFQTLPEDDQSLLSAQLGTMTAYLQILNIRISRARGTIQ